MLAYWKELKTFLSDVFDNQPSTPMPAILTSYARPTAYSKQAKTFPEDSLDAITLQLGDHITNGLRLKQQTKSNWK